MRLLVFERKLGYPFQAVVYSKRLTVVKAGLFYINASLKLKLDEVRQSG